MGRHSAPDDDPGDAPDGALQAGGVALRERVVAPGRHSRPDDDAPDTTQINGHAPSRPSPKARRNGGEVSLDELIAADHEVDEVDTQRIPPVLDEPAVDPPVVAEASVVEVPAETPAVEAPVVEAPVVDAPTADPPAVRPAPDTAPVSTAPPPGHPGHPVLRGAAHNSAADLQLVRSHRGALAACAAAVVLPFVVEIVVLLALGTLDRHSVLVWLWAPLVVAGVLLGTSLDIAHRRVSLAAARPAGVDSRRPAST